MSCKRRLREATERDAGSVAELWTEAYVTLGVGGRTDPYTTADFRQSSQHGDVFVIEGPGGLAGVVVLYGPDSPGRVVARGSEAELSRLAVAAPARGRGLGRALVEHCERRARAAGWVAIALWSRPAQTEAHRLYESLGYRRLPGRDSTDGTGQRRVAFGLALAPGARMQS